MNIIKSNGKQYVSRDDVMKLLMNNTGDYSMYDLGWWLETKTVNNFTVVELEFINKTFAVIREISRNLDEMRKSVALFENEWTAKIKNHQVQSL